MSKRVLIILCLLIIGLSVASCILTDESNQEAVLSSSTPSPSNVVVSSATAEPTATSLPTATPIPELTSTPAPTVEPTLPPMRLFLNDRDRIASVYPDSVEIIQAEETSYLPNAALGISFNMPVAYALELKSDPAHGAWEMIGGGLQDTRLLKLSVGLMPQENAPKQADVESWYSPNPAGSLSTSEETYEFENGFGVIFTELYSYKGHFGMDVVYTLVLDYDEVNSIGIGYFLSEEIYKESDIDQTIDAGIIFVQTVQESFSQFTAIPDVLGTSHYRILTGICPIDTDETYGFTPENPIVMASSISDPVTAALMGPAIAEQFFETLLYDGSPITYVRLGSIATDETILDEYQVTLSNGESVTLFVDQYESAPYRVPAGFGCVGILNPEYLLEFEE